MAEREVRAAIHRTTEVLVAVVLVVLVVLVTPVRLRSVQPVNLVLQR
jgi:hypothetical protein